MREAGSTPPVFLVPRLPEGEDAVLDGEEARHAATVRRLRPGEWLVLSDGAGGLADCVVAQARPGRDAELILDVRQWRHEPAPELTVTVVQALAKGDRGELAVELATEAGADAVLPWRAARSVARWDEGQRGAKALQRWRASARSAAKQARRAWLPEVREPVSTRELVELVRGSARTLVLDAEAAGPIDAAVLPERGEVLLVVGPEGGITAEELAALTDAGAVGVRLGHTVLRTSTAGAVALGAIGVLSTRWR
ncbi:16S rRNA (uracil(1498)-N(3))-methyltransferase [Amycolatopsis palatopharyngis]|uniref:16S rRNA (uracil(1498)-N(3))-methyltransferase n=1 Tax=Amycolatopsis palatopharyngis TaxID=187982 RepID=UPI000E224AD0